MISAETILNIKDFAINNDVIVDFSFYDWGLFIAVWRNNKRAAFKISYEEVQYCTIDIVKYKLDELLEELNAKE